jgi:signal peptidase II
MKKYLLKIVKSFVWLFVLIMLADYFTKIWAANNDVYITIIDNFFYFDYTRNTGAAWSILSGQMTLLAIISSIAGVALIVYFIINYRKLNLWLRAIIMLLAGGTWGNFIDRAFYEEGVIDFISFKFGNYYFPTFNIADMSLVIGVFALFIVMFISEIKTKQKQNEQK